MTVPSHLLHAVSKHREAGRRTALVLRHSERHHVIDLHHHEDVLLTERGHAMAREAGGLLARFAPQMRLHHSPVERCAETARGIAEGAQTKGASAEVKGVVSHLAYPFLLDKKRAYDIVLERGGHFIRAWFNGDLPADVFEPKAVAARAQLRAIVDHIDGQSLSIFVSHDWNIALMREALLGVQPETTWPGYLDGLVIALDGDTIHVELDGTIKRHTR